MNMKFSAPCIFGLEGLCANELRYLGVENVNAENGRVTFTGDWSTLALANINSRYAERILILLAEFEVHTFDNLFEGVKAIPWEDYIGISEAFPVKGRCLDSDLMSVPDCQKIVKKAVADRLSQKYMLPWFDETGAPHQIQFLILRNKVSIMLDTSGAGLHKRGYRADSNDAPIKETLAAAMVDLSRVRANHFVTDPMCGSGTILIEAAMKALNIAPGLNRYFACEHSFYSIIEYYDLTVHGMVDAVYCGDSVADVDYLAGLTALGIEVEILYLALDNGDYVCCTDCAHRGHLLVNFLSSSRSFPS